VTDAVNGCQATGQRWTCLYSIRRVLNRTKCLLKYIPSVLPYTWTTVERIFMKLDTRNFDLNFRQIPVLIKIGSR